MKKYHHRSLVMIKRVTRTDMIFMGFIRGFAPYATNHSAIRIRIQSMLAVSQYK